MKRLAETALLVLMIALGVCAVAADPPKSVTPFDPQRKVSPEGLEFLEKRSRGTPFGTMVFDLDGLRAGMGARNEPRVEGVKLIPIKIGEIPCEWVLAPGVTRNRPRTRGRSLGCGRFCHGTDLCRFTPYADRR